jgi:hypothetical protein
MNERKPLLKTCQVCMLVLLLVIAGSACSSLGLNSANVPAVQPVQATQVVTRVVTQDVTREVTRIIEVPVTVTPAPTLESSSTPEISTSEISPAGLPELPLVSILVYSDCLYGPGSFYLYKTSMAAGSQMEVVGRNQDGTWINVEDVHGWDACWIPADQAKLSRGSVNDLPLVSTALPITRYDYSSPSAIARRSGNEVTVSWKAVWMSTDEVRGYLIEAWVCQDGKYIYLPVFVSTTYDENVGTISVKIRDETGCAETPSARITSAGMRGYTLWEKIFWPPY